MDFFSILTLLIIGVLIVTEFGLLFQISRLEDQRQADKMRIHMMENQIYRLSIELSQSNNLLEGYKLWMGEDNVTQASREQTPESESSVPHPEGEVLPSPMHQYQDGECSVCGCSGTFTTHCPGARLKPEVINHVSMGLADYTRSKGWVVKGGAV